MRLLLSFLLLFFNTVLANAELYERGREYYYGDGVEQSFDKAFKAFTHAAKVGDLEAKTALGLMYIEGTGVNQDDQKGVEYLKEAAANDNAKAQYYLGSMYYLGIGVERNLKTAHRWIKKSAEQGYADAQQNLALMYEQGKGTKKNPILANKWRLKSAASGNRDEQYSLGVAYLDAEDYDNAYIWLEKSANQEHAKAQEKLAGLIENEFFLLKFGENGSLKKSLDLYQKSYENGNTRLSYKLASIYDNKPFSNYRKSHKFYQEALKQGELAAYLDIARHYKFGQGVRKNLEKAYSFTIAAARKGYKPAWSQVVEMYLEGAGVKKSIKKAKYWLKKLAKSGDKGAIKQLNDL